MADKPTGEGGQKKRVYTRTPGSVRDKREREVVEYDRLQAEARERILAKATVTLSPDLIADVTKGIREGNYASVVARQLGVPPGQYREWLDRGKAAWVELQSGRPFISKHDPLALCVELYLLVEQADAEWEVDTVARMKEHIERGANWVPHMTMLQRRHPERWDTRGRSQGDEQKSWEEQLKEWQSDVRQADVSQETSG